MGQGDDQWGSGGVGEAEEGKTGGRGAAARHLVTASEYQSDSRSPVTNKKRPNPATNRYVIRKRRVLRSYAPGPPLRS